MDKSKFISEKIGELITEGYSRSQAAAIAYNMASKKYAQFGGSYYPDLNQTIQGQMQSPQQDFSYLPQQPIGNINPITNLNGATINNSYPPIQNPVQPFPRYATDSAFVEGQAPDLTGLNKPTDTYDYNANYMNMTTADENLKTDSGANVTQNINRVNLVNPYTGVGLENALNYMGRGFGDKDPYKIGVGGALSAIKGARSFLSGYGTEDKRVQDEYYRKLFETNPNYVYKQQGGLTEQEELASRRVVQKPVYQIRQGVSTNEVKEGSLQPSNNLTRVEYKDGTYDYLNSAGWRDFQNMNNYRIYVEAQRAKQNPAPVGQLAVRQQGGEIKNSEMLTGQFITDEPGANINLEGGEYVKKAQTGEVKEVVGEPHHRNGELAPGVDARLDEGDKVASKYTKIPTEDIKELKKTYDIPLKRGDTFADALKKHRKKIRITTETDKMAGLLEKVEYQEKNTKDETTKGLNIEALQSDIQKSKKRLGLLNEISSEFFDDLFSRQERIPKKGKPGELFDDNGKLIEETRNTDYAQQGMQVNGYMQIAQKYGISPERAQELLAMQQGGMQSEQEEQMEGQMSNPQEEQGEVSPEQMVAEALQSGAAPEEVLQALVEQGMSQEEATALIQAVIQQLQGGGQEQQVAQQGKMYAQEGWKAKLKKDYTYGAAAEKSYVDGAFEEPNYGYDSLENIAERFKFLADQRGVDYSKLDLTKRSDIDKLASQTQQWDKKNLPNLTQDYGMSIGLTKQGLDYLTTTPLFAKLQKENPTLANKVKAAKRGTFDTDNFSKDDRDLLMGKIKDSGDKNFADKNYLDNQAYFRGIDKQQIYFNDKDEFEKYKKEKGNAIDGYYKTDKKGVYVKPILLQPKEFKTEKEKQEWIAKYGKNTEKQHGEFMAEDPNSDVYYTPFAPGENPPKEKDLEAKGLTNVDVVNNTRNVMPMLPIDLRIPPSALTPLAKEQIRLQRMDAIKQTPEPMLAEQERMRQSDIERVQQTGISPQQQEAILGAGLASSQLAANDAISKVEGFNAQSQYQADNYNLQAAAKEDITNSQFNQDYQNKMLGSMANTERDWRRFYNEGNLQNRADYQSIENANLLNAMQEQYAYIPGKGIEFLNNQPVDIGRENLTQKERDDASQAQLNKYMLAQINQIRGNV